MPLLIVIYSDTLLKRKIKNLSCFRDLEIAVQRVPPEKRVGHLVPNELRDVRAQHGQRPILSPACRLLGDSGDRVERG